MKDAGARGERTVKAQLQRTNLSVTSVPRSLQTPPPPPAARTRLAHLLIAKSIAEALFIGALAVGFYYFAFNPHFRGSVDEASARGVSGWVVDESQPALRVEVQLYLDGKFVASRLADEVRPDIYAAGRAADERHGFTFPLEVRAGGEHEARVYAVHASGGEVRRTLQLVGRAMRFHITPESGEPDDSSKPPPPASGR